MDEPLDQEQLAARAAQAQSLRNLAHTWYALSLACKRIGAMIERAAKKILHESTDDSSISEANDENATPRDVFLPS